MTRLIIPALLVVFSLTSCDKLLKTENAQNNGSIEDQLQISSPSKPEIVAGFEAISKAAREHNRVLLENLDNGKPANELAYSAGIDFLARSARENGGLAKQLIDAVSATCIYEKGLFTPFDTIDRQLDGMPRWSADQATQLRGYIHIMDEIIITYDNAVTYLESGEDPLQRRNFDKYKVPPEVGAEFLRLRKLWGKEISESELGMFREGRMSLQCSRDALTTANPAEAAKLTKEARQHEQKSRQFKARMITALRKELKA